MKDLWFVRHGESELNTYDHLVVGRCNSSPLSEKGVRQAISLGKRLNDEQINFDRFYSSTAVRAVETLRHVIEQTAYPDQVVAESPDLLEMDQGDWERRPRLEVYTPEVFEQLKQDCYHFSPPHGESQKQVEERMFSWLQKEIFADAEQNIRALIVTHGMAIKCLLRGILESNPSMTYKININNTSITQLIHNHRGWNIERVNDVSHLQ